MYDHDERNKHFMLIVIVTTIMTMTINTTTIIDCMMLT